MRLTICMFGLAVGIGCASDPPTLGLDEEFAVDLDDILHATARYSACTETGLDSFVVRSLQALATTGPPADRMRAFVTCVNSADGCEDARRCVGLTPADCLPGKSRCDGNVQVRCFDVGGRTYESRERCADSVMNSKCATENDADAVCVSTTRCATEDEQRCEGNTLLSCTNQKTGFAQKANCAAQGRVCQQNGDRAHCIVRETTRCRPCTGDVSHACEDGVIRSEVDCAILGLTCDPDPILPGSLACSAAEPVCHFDDNHCVGAQARVCHNGKWFNFDCSAFEASCAVLGDGRLGCRLNE